MLWEPILSLSGAVLSQCNFNINDVMTIIGSIKTTLIKIILDLLKSNTKEKILCFQNTRLILS